MKTKWDEIERIKALLSYNILRTEPEQFYNDLVELISQICETPISIISFIDEHHQWYKAKKGMEDEQIPIQETICQFTMQNDGIMEVEDAKKDIRFVNNPHVQAENGIRYYAGISLESSDGYPIGTVCVADTRPRALDASQINTLKALASLVMQHLEAQKKNSKLQEELQKVLNSKIKIAEKKIVAKDQVYTNLLAAISKSNAVIEFDVDGTIIQANDHFATLFGYEEEELIGKDHKSLLVDWTDNQYQDFWKQMAAGHFSSGRFKRKHKDGSTIWIQASYSPVINEKGKVVKITKIAQDITDDVKAKTALEHLNEQKDQFIANISHELRTPIHAIVGFTDLLMENETNDEKAKFLRSIKGAGDSLLYLVNGILDLGKIEAGVFQFDYQSFSLSQLIEYIFSMLSLKATQKKIDFSYLIEDNVPDNLIGDKNRLAQILINLIDNALKFTNEGTVKLLIKTNQNLDDKTLISFSVSDNGIGISKDKLASIFERFTQAEENTSRKYGGTGLGLNICKLLVEKQGGNIAVESIKDIGTRFEFTLPFEVSNTTLHSKQKKSFKDYSKLRGKILLCEDNEINQLIASSLFQQTAVDLDIASNGKIALEKLKENNYDLILMDIQMPEMDGYQTTVAVRQELKLEIPIVALTAHSMFKERDKCLQIGMNDYLSKPFRKEEIFEKVGHWLKQGLETVSPINKSIEIKLTFIKESSGGNVEFEKKMLELFIETLEASASQFNKFIELRDLVALSKYAHKLKSSVGMLEADTSLLDKLEKVTSIEKAKELILQIKQLFVELQKLAKYELNQL